MMNATCRIVLLVVICVVVVVLLVASVWRDWGGGMEEGTEGVREGGGEGWGITNQAVEGGRRRPKNNNVFVVAFELIVNHSLTLLKGFLKGICLFEDCFN